ncbi:type II toxin-antitoxin system RelE/ParE family toxin [Mucilaginibacter sp.]|uniref:type II toxin-antitoxin system RelE/ParE family toxin n=1 Tax=Mucilaginibacter sp. TaxID=1882438 RepID=UPI00326598E7
MYQITTKPRAAKMAKEAYDWYEEQQIGLGELFLKELAYCYDRIEAWPTAYAKIKKNYRQVIFSKFPYVVVFEVIKRDVIVYAVFHTSRSVRKKFKK